MNLQCKMCGGNVEVNPGNKLVGTCRFCGSTMTLPRLDSDADAAAFNYANELRRQCDFDGAISAYREILARDPSNAEAYWGVCLSRYGVEYVQDPKSQKRHPTLHRLNRKRVTEDTDYRFAMDNAADEATRQLYSPEAARIDRIRAEALKLVNNEAPYDVFICYKEREERGGLSEDYGLAQSIYYKLDKLGYRVFFSHITLLGKLGEAYEPYIYAALNSAKVMLVVGTRPEHVNATWVRNEWSRYLAIAEEDPRKKLVVCYRGMNPYDLPEELKYLQAMNLADLYALDSIVATVRQVVGVRGAAAPGQTAAQRPRITNVDALDRVRHLLSTGKYEEAERQCAALEAEWGGDSVYWLYRAMASSRNLKPADMMAKPEPLQYLATARQLAEANPSDAESARVLQACQDAENKLSAYQEENGAKRQLEDLKREAAQRRNELNQHRQELSSLDSQIKDMKQAQEAAVAASASEVGSKLRGLRFWQFVRLLLLLGCVILFMFSNLSAKYGIFAARDKLAEWPEWCRGGALAIWDWMLAQARQLNIRVDTFHSYMYVAIAVGAIVILRMLNRRGKIRQLKQQRTAAPQEDAEAAERLKRLESQRTAAQSSVARLESQVSKLDGEVTAARNRALQLKQEQSWEYKF